MKKILLASAGLFALGVFASANAADLAPRPYAKAPAPMVAVYDWTGFYIGLNGGWGTSRNCWDLTNVNGIVVAPAVREGCHNASGGTVGGQLGYRWQAANWVFGLEAQGNWADLNGSSLSDPAAFGAFVTNRTKVDGIGLFTGQVGYAFNNVLWYVKGGAAATHSKHSGLITGTGIVFDEASETRWGAAVGTGIEVGFAPNWSVGLEYNHLFMGDRDITFPATAIVNQRIDTISQDVDLVTVRLNYRFGGPVVARY
ncbi:MAG: porin family protein [Bradyrhizobium sp.]|uniref:outer membrane protein n=1 Tax=Bradyrhizobium sp. TaxID=376 RepID=UPI0025C0850E|nr:outer membrane beta-barrel protein [Bradyrhizobium sp.]MBI5261241.1 porin family protein [Bradyrhizobium sp.]